MSTEVMAMAGDVFLVAGKPGGVQLPEVETKTSTRRDRLWDVIVWDDPINLMSYVVYVFQKVFGFSEQLATRHMIEVHREGRSVLTSCELEKAEMFVSRLHRHGLQATIEKQSG
ncbi:MAG: ATP-dependent Clp protease adapter ClpS [Planctomycetota bacterium]